MKWERLTHSLSVIRSRSQVKLLECLSFFLVKLAGTKHWFHPVERSSFWGSLLYRSCNLNAMHVKAWNGYPSGVTFVTLDVVHAVIFYLSKSTTLYEVYVWGDRCGREVPHFDSRPVSISDPRVGITPLGLFGPAPPDGNGPTTIACGPAAELTFVLLVWWLLPRRFLYAHQRTSRC